MSNAFLEAAAKEAPGLLSSLTLLALAWGVGHRLTVFWNLRQKRRELDLENGREFHALYGEFFATWKLWNYYRRDVGAGALPGASRWDLLSRACRAEGRLEALLVRLACDRSLDSSRRRTLGVFRQLYQMLRESIRDDKALAWDHSDHPHYRAFKSLAPAVAALTIAEGKPVSSTDESAAALREIAANRLEEDTLLSAAAQHAIEADETR